MSSALPDFISPMLAQIGEPFDSDEHLFEIKWDGTRALAFIEEGDYRLINRRRNVSTHRYPEFQFLADLPSGLVLDGEIVVYDGDRPSFRGMLSREQARDPRRIERLMVQLPAVYVVFDVLYVGGRSVMSHPLVDRRECLESIVESAEQNRLAFSDGVVGCGLEYFANVSELGLEGVVAKQLRSRYHPGKRGDSWTKIKQVRQLPCAIVGFVPDGPTDIRNLVLAADDAGELRLCGKVGTGFDDALRRQIGEKLRAHIIESPFIACKEPGALWVEPGHYCIVNYYEWTESGALRAPVFVRMATL